MSSWSRLVRFNPVSNPSQILIGEPVDSSLDVGLASFSKLPISINVYSGSSILSAGSPLPGRVEEVAQLLSPLAEGEVGSIRCIGLNYTKHAVECKLPIPEVPILFLKPSSSLTGPWPAKIVVPKFTVADDTADYESEMTIIIGKTAKNVKEEEALDYVLGYTAANDVSARTSQFNQSQWCFSKGFDTSCPIGPAVISTKIMPDPSKLLMRGIKNGVVMQESGLDDLIFNVPKIVSFLSQGTTLQPGTIILTGTPNGIGLYSKNCLKTGDDFRVEISGGIGTLINLVEHEE